LARKLAAVLPSMWRNGQPVSRSASPADHPASQSSSDPISSPRPIHRRSSQPSPDGGTKLEPPATSPSALWRARRDHEDDNEPDQVAVDLIEMPMTD
jgi:hypothetical protein